jgi:hypothetical protein
LDSDCNSFSYYQYHESLRFLKSVALELPVEAAHLYTVCPSRCPHCCGEKSIDALLIVKPSAMDRASSLWLWCL